MAENSLRQEIRRQILRTLVEDVEMNLARFDPATGRFLTEGGWAVTNQDIIYPLALLYRTQDPDNPYAQDGRILEYVLRGGDALRDFQYPDGQVEFVKVDGSTWGPIYMPWSMYHWLETYALLEEELDPDRRQRWAEGLTLAYDGITANLANGRVHNIPTWNAMASYRAGQIFGRPEWQEAGRRMMQRVVEAQTPQGYWREHHGPTTLYNTVYVHALGLYYFFAQDDTVLPALARATDFHIRYTYPDGRLMETIDGRVKYHDQVNVRGLSAFSLFPQGRRYARFLVENWLAQRAAHPLPHLTYNLTAQGPKIAGGDFGLSPLVAPVLHHFADGPEAPIPQDQEHYHIHDPEHAIIRRQDGWLYCLSGIVTPPVETRWGQDRQQFLSVWHQTAGLVIGGGNAKDQPEFSTFVVGEGVVGEGPDRLYLPTGATLQPGAEADGVVLAYGEHVCTLQVAIEDGQGMRLTLSGPEDAPAWGQLAFKLRPGQPLQTGNGENRSVTAAAWSYTAGENDWIAHGPWRLELPAGATVRWPVHPFNPYAADGAGPLEEAAAIVTVPLDRGPATLRLEPIAP
ncbi:MAG: hypothetical protein KatS3mg050_2513 [Litorilinea sp.]|nr:MAG: hypothetical protein KatS3mg050_2513 [Litorilinea sp.]